jgi:hypothetical protein
MCAEYKARRQKKQRNNKECVTSKEQKKKGVQAEHKYTSRPSRLPNSKEKKSSAVAEKGARELKKK